MRTAPIGAALALLLNAAVPATIADDEVIEIFDRAAMELDRDSPEDRAEGEVTIRSGGQVIERIIDLPGRPASQREARRITAIVDVEPVIIEEDGRATVADRWTRLGSINIVLPQAPGVAPASGAAGTPRGTHGSAPPADSGREVELMRFITGFGGRGSFEADLTALAPLLAGRTTFRAHLSTWMKPAWRLSLRLMYTSEGVGSRRPALAIPLFNEPLVTAVKNRLRAVISIPPGHDLPRLRILTTGHATDGTAGDEFSPRLHILRIDGREVAMWRPWSERGAALRPVNPMSGRRFIDGRELWSSDLDRAGWHPGTVVEPLLMPMPELSPGAHVVELEVRDIRPASRPGPGGDASQPAAHGYWRISAVVVADEPWPQDGEEEPEAPGAPGVPGAP